jgi:hypothetical protein
MPENFAGTTRQTACRSAHEGAAPLFSLAVMMVNSWKYERDSLKSHKRGVTAVSKLSPQSSPLGSPPLDPNPMAQTSFESSSPFLGPFFGKSEGSMWGSTPP